MWVQLIAALLGAWATAAPGVLGYEGALRTSQHVVGPLIASVGCMAMAECLRPLRRCNLVLGAWTCAAPWLLGAPDTAAALDALATGAAVIATSAIRGRIRHGYGGGWRLVWKSKDSYSSPGAAG